MVDFSCPPCPFGYPQVCMLTPPPCPVPTAPKYVKPMSLPMPDYGSSRGHGHCDPSMDLNSRHANFYNNYNIDWHMQGRGDASGPSKRRKAPCHGVTIDGKSPICKECHPKKPTRGSEECPTGFKPCTMKMIPPCNCADPLATWCAVVQPCPPKFTK